MLVSRRDALAATGAALGGPPSHFPPPPLHRRHASFRKGG